MLYHLNRLHDFVRGFSGLDFIAPLLIRLIVAPVMIAAGYGKLVSFSDTAYWFGEYLGLPFPELMAALAIGAELIGGIFILVGFATRYMAVPLMVTMLVAAFSVHWENGWAAIAPSSTNAHPALVFDALGIPAAEESLEQTAEVKKRLDRGRAIMAENGNASWLNEKGSFVILQNGIEFAAIYFVFLLVLFFTGGGRFVSIDHYLYERFRDISE